jgi:hypothetical protein
MIFGPALGGVVYEFEPTLPMLCGAVASFLLGVFFLWVRVPDPAEQATAST